MITLIGKNSQLGMSLAEHSKIHIDHISSQDLDLRNTSEISRVLKRYDNQILINCSAFNDVEDAEKNNDAYLINHIGVSELAKHCSNYNIFLIHISTDFVFDGIKGNYLEFDEINPINEYGKSKAEGEKSIQKHCKHYVIIRTSWLYSYFPTKNNFLYKIKSLIVEGQENLYGANDIFGSPTSVDTLAEGILSMMPHLDDHAKFNRIYHLSNLGRTSRFTYLKEISQLMNKKYKKNTSVHEVQNDFFNLSASRPGDSSMNSSLFCDTFSYLPKDWKTSLEQTISRL
jgi:dTDP-4-dehydrorhamnose reductase